MIGGLLQIFTIYGHLTIICELIRARKILLYLLSHSKRKHIHTLMFNKFRSKKLFMAIFHLAFILMFICFGIHILVMLFELDKNFQMYRAWYFYVKNLAFIISFLIFLRLIFIRLKIELKAYKL